MDCLATSYKPPYASRLASAFDTVYGRGANNKIWFSRWWSISTAREPEMPYHLPQEDFLGFTDRLESSKQSPSASRPTHVHHQSVVSFTGYCVPNGEDLAKLAQVRASGLSVVSNHSP